MKTLHSVFVIVVMLMLMLVSVDIRPASAQSNQKPNSQAGQVQSCQVWIKGQSPSAAKLMTASDCFLQASMWGALQNAEVGFGSWGNYLFWVNRRGQVYVWNGSKWVVEVMTDDDGDGILYDACPRLQEVYNKIFDMDGCPDNIETLVNLTGKDLNLFWARMFQMFKLPYKPVAILSSYTAQRPLQTGCGRTTPNNAFYCPQDHGIYYDSEFVHRQMFVEGHGDFSAVVIIAHEWGHAIQAQLPRDRAERGMQRELQADCFAGVYAKSLADGEGLIRLDPGDLDEGAHQFFMLGDDSPWFDPSSHGTHKQRVQSFLGGLEHGISACFPQ